MTKYWNILLISLAIFCSCSDNTPRANTSSSHHNLSYLAGEPPHHYTYRGITVITSLPRGGRYTDPTEKNFGFRIFRAHLRNDTTVDAELNINFSQNPVNLVPDTSASVRVFLFPPSMAPEQSEDAYNFGVSSIEPFLDKGLTKLTTQKITLNPGKEDYFYIGVLMDPENGVARARLFFNEQNLLFQLNVSPPTDSTIISCGQVVFKDQGDSQQKSKK